MHDASLPQSVSPADIPSPPAAIAKIVRLASDPDVSVDKLGVVISSDPVFTAELLRTVNSPFYGLKVQIGTGARAAAVLGTRALRNLAICFAVRDSLRSSGFRAEDLKSFWEDSLRRAVAARLLARHAGIGNPDEAFTIGLLQDFGMLALLKSNREQLQSWPEVRALGPAERRMEEQTRFGTTHDKLASFLGARWGLPEALTTALAFHHNPDSPDVPAALRPLTRVAMHADTISSVFTAAANRAALQEARAGLERDCGMGPGAVDTMLAAVSVELEEAANGLGMRVARQPTFEEIIREANRSLVQMNVSYEELTQRLERTLTEKNELATQLQEANGRLERLAYFDPLTGLPNRRRFEELFRLELRRASESGKPLSFVMVDLDKFKNVNDTYGHPFGDAVLQAVSAAIMRVSRTSDIKARLGGEELAVLLPETDAATASRIADAMRCELAGTTMTSPKGPVTVTASFGGATFQGALMGGNHEDAIIVALTEAADRGLYASKHGGRNQVTWVAFEVPKGRQ